MALLDNEISAELAYEKKRAPQHIEGINCDVSSCAFHDGDNYCCAKNITIGRTYSKNETDTVCSTFRKRKM